jgi:hypothetical protein
LVIGDQAELNVSNAPGSLPIDVTMETQDLYASQAIELFSKVLGDTMSTPTDRALALCWIGHLVADVHQPCHAGSLYMEGVFTEEDGDRGANRIFTKQNRIMHALWDGLLGRDFDLGDTRRRIQEISKDQELLSNLTHDSDWLDPQVWLAESRVAATQSVYTQSVLDDLRQSIGGKRGKPIDLDKGYLKNAGRVAQQRALQASHRLAEQWRTSLNALSK